MVSIRSAYGQHMVSTRRSPVKRLCSPAGPFAVQIDINGSQIESILFGDRAPRVRCTPMECVRAARAVTLPKSRKCRHSGWMLPRLLAWLLHEGVARRGQVVELLEGELDVRVDPCASASAGVGRGGLGGGQECDRFRLADDATCCMLRVPPNNRARTHPPTCAR